MNNFARCRVLFRLSRVFVLVLSLALICFITLATFRGENFINEPHYMQFQFWICLAFMADFFFELWLVGRRRWRYFFRHLWFFAICIPYLNIIQTLDLHVSAQVMEYLRYVPLIRGAYVMVIIINYISTSRIMSIFMSYLSIIVLMLYFSSIIFYVREHPVNPQISGYFTSLWWCALEFTTIGAPINPVTPTGKVLAAILSAMGVIMFPLFTVYLSDLLRRHLNPKSR